MPILSSALLNIHALRTLIINTITLAVALGLARNRRRNPPLPARPWPPGREAPYVQIIIPARNEERNIPPLLQTLLQQQYLNPHWGITLVDDASDDATWELAAHMASRHERLSVVKSPPLPTGWTGKAHAMFAGYKLAPPQAEWLLFVDADTRHAPVMLPSVMLRALESGADMLSLVIQVKMGTFWERLLVPQVGELYTLLVGSMDEVNRPGGRAAANGQFILVRRELFASLITLPEVHADVAEDRALAQAARDCGYTVRLEHGQALVHARVYSSLREMWAGYSKTLFWASGHNLPKAIAVVVALTLYALVPPFALLNALLNKAQPHRRAALTAARLQLLPMLALRAAICHRLGVSPVYAFAYPLAVTTGNALLLYSIYRVLSGKGVEWKGRTYTRQ